MLYEGIGNPKDFVLVNAQGREWSAQSLVRAMSNQSIASPGSDTAPSHYILFAKTNKRVRYSQQKLLHTWGVLVIVK